MAAYTRIILQEDALEGILAVGAVGGDAGRDACATSRSAKIKLRAKIVGIAR